VQVQEFYEFENINEMTIRAEIIKILDKEITGHGLFNNVTIEGKGKSADEIIKLLDLHSVGNNKVAVCGICGEPTDSEEAKICIKCWDMYDIPQTDC